MNEMVTGRDLKDLDLRGPKLPDIDSVNDNCE